jgi:hypothetical protein
VETACWSTSAHYVLISNSIDGTAGEFYDRVAGAAKPHDSAKCEEHEKYLSKVIGSNFARIVMGYFGQHDQYPFETDSCGYEYVGSKMAAEGLGKKAVDNYWRSVREVEECGTGERPWMYTLEHAYTELPFVVGRHVRKVIEQKMPPVPIGYRYID